MDKSPPGFREIGARAGISAMTVSRVMRKSPGVSEETRQRVLEAAEALGYRPDPLHAAFMHRLRHGRQADGATVIAYLTTHLTDSPMESFPYIRNIRLGAENRCRNLGYRLEEFRLPSVGGNPSRLAQILQARGIRGVVVAPLAKRGRLAMDFTSFAAAAIGSTLYHPRLHRSKADHAMNMQVALRELRHRGFRRPGLVLDEDALARTEYLADAVMLHFQSGIQKKLCVPSLIIPSFDRKKILAWINKWKPDAVLTVDYGIVGWLAENDHRPAVVNLGSIPGDGCDYGIDQLHEEIGAAAVDLVSEQLLSNSLGPPKHAKVVNITGEWVGTKTAPNPPRAG